MTSTACHRWASVLSLALLVVAPTARPAEETGTASPLDEKSPWLLAPIFNSNPKLGTAFGAIGGYVHYFDEKSRPSIFAVTAQYSNTDSMIGGAQARTSWAEDSQRLIAGVVYGYVKNDYDDYLGTGVPLKSNGDLRSGIVRYLYRVKDNWFIGAQGLYQNFAISGETDFDDVVLDTLGVAPYKSGGLGLVAQHDSRDNENTPTQGWYLNFNNMAYRESLGGDNDFDVYRIDFRYYMQHGDRHVFALRQLNHFTNDAPTVSRASIQLRGYKIGQYNAKYMSSIEGEERYRFSEKITATLFAGVACLYGDDAKCTDSENLYPMAGAGIQYVLKPKEGIVMSLEYAWGEDGNYGGYLKMGYAF